jgi:hypothetical protein
MQEKHFCVVPIALQQQFIHIKHEWSFIMNLVQSLHNSLDNSVDFWLNSGEGRHVI